MICSSGVPAISGRGRALLQMKMRSRIPRSRRARPSTVSASLYIEAVSSAFTPASNAVASMSFTVACDGLPVVLATP